MRRILWLAFAIIFTLSVLLVGCSGAGSGSGGNSAGQTSNVQETTDESQENPFGMIKDCPAGQPFFIPLLAG